MTMFFRRSSIMVGYLLEQSTQACVLEVINKIYESVGHDLFKKSIPLLLTDNGREFLMPDELAYNGNGLERRKVFYCDPNASYQKVVWRGITSSSDISYQRANHLTF